MRSVAVDTKARSYEILIEEGVLDNPAEHLEKVWTKRRCVILTDTNVYPLYAKKVSKIFLKPDSKTSSLRLKLEKKQIMANAQQRCFSNCRFRFDQRRRLDRAWRRGCRRFGRTVRFALYARNLVCSVSDFASCTG